jgi:hypothetical protein
MAFASGTLTVSDDFDDTETLVIGSKTYTMQVTLTNVDGNVQIGASAAATLVNILQAITLSGVAGTDYAAAMTRHPQVTAITTTATTLVVRSRVDGLIGNAIGTTETHGEGAWGAVTLAGGTGSVDDTLRSLAAQAPASIKQALIDLTDPEGDE